MNRVESADLRGSASVSLKKKKSGKLREEEEEGGGARSRDFHTVTCRAPQMRTSSTFLCFSELVHVAFHRCCWTVTDSCSSGGESFFFFLSFFCEASLDEIGNNLIIITILNGRWRQLYYPPSLHP